MLKSACYPPEPLLKRFRRNLAFHVLQILERLLQPVHNVGHLQAGARPPPPPRHRNSRRQPLQGWCRLPRRLVDNTHHRWASRPRATRRGRRSTCLGGLPLRPPPARPSRPRHRCPRQLWLALAPAPWRPRGLEEAPGAAAAGPGSRPWELQRLSPRPGQWALVGSTAATLARGLQRPRGASIPCCCGAGRRWRAACCLSRR
mmetsp:Transcript_78831/g.218037  ORF Transcript_78831/g.218037 Transcript_78831/m.218037 type:complete len:202 (+) Transcript_78831:123-728(+)